MNTLLERIQETLESLSSSFLKEKDLDKRRNMIVSTILNVPVEDLENGLLIQTLAKVVSNNAFTISRCSFDEDDEEMEGLLNYVNNILLE